MQRPVSRINVANPPRVKPWMIWDGDCRFCGKWIRRWEQATGDAVEYHPYQKVVDRFPEIGEEGFCQAVHFIGLDGVARRGAEAVFLCLAAGGRYSFLSGMYARFDWFAVFTSYLYSFVAQHRMLFSKATTLLWGKSVEHSSFRFSGALFSRGLGLIYLIAFASFGVQMAGLVGAGGILPMAEHTAAVHEHFASQDGGGSPMWVAPSLLWLNGSEAMLQALVWAGALGSLLLVFGLLPGLSALVCWVCYLSLVNAVPVFLSYQWDILLLEAGLLLVFMGPWVLRESFRGPREPSRVMRWLVWWLIFRLMVESGAFKLLDYPGVESTWKELTALNFHYFTQPIPNALSRFFHGLPDGFQQFSVIGMFVIELGVPFLIFFPRRLRTIACLLLVFLQVLIIASGNYGFFNLLTLVLCLLLIDDQSLPNRLQRWMRPPPQENELAEWLAPFGWVRIPLAALCFFFGSIQLVQACGWLDSRDLHNLGEGQQPAWMPLYFSLERIHAVNTYGLFRMMTTERPEIVIEGSDDGKDWKPYVFKYKPGPLDRRPPWATPHMPRLDWQMWFAALQVEQSGRYPGWFGAFLQGLAQNREPVTGLLESNPFPEAPPRYLRLRLYHYTFSTPEEMAETGQYWQRTLLPNYTQQLRTENLK